MLHRRLLVGLQLILLLFRLIVGGHFIWLLIWSLLVRPCRLIGVNPVLVDQISLVGIFGKCQSWGEEEGKGTKPGQAHKRCLCWCEGKGWTGLEVVARVEVVTSRGPAHLPTCPPHNHRSAAALQHPAWIVQSDMYFQDIESTLLQQISKKLFFLLFLFLFLQTYSKVPHSQKLGGYYTSKTLEFENSQILWI